MSENTMATQCVNCGGTLKFDPTVGKLKCEFCDSVFEPDAVEQMIAAEEARSKEKESGADWGNDADAMQALGCTTCGAQLLADQNTGATRCPYCGNSTIIPAQFSGAAKPDCLIPFALTKEQAMEKYRGYYEKRWLLPSSFLQNNQVEEIQGVYVPFWLYDGTASISATYEAYDERSTQTETIRDLFAVERRGTIQFHNVPADASQRMQDALMDSIEPYKFEALKPFSMSYLPGFLAERFDVDDSDDRSRIEKRVKETTSQRTRATVSHEGISKSDEHINVRFTGKQYVLLPVWCLTTRWNDQVFTFAMNGQTGQFTGDLPVDKGKLFALGAAAFLLPGILIYLLMKDIVPALIIAAIICLIAVAGAHGSMKPVHNAHGASDYMDKQIRLTLEKERHTRTERKPKEQNRSNNPPSASGGGQQRP